MPWIAFVTAFVVDAGTGVDPESVLPLTEPCSAPGAVGLGDVRYMALAWQSPVYSVGMPQGYASRVPSLIYFTIYLGASFRFLPSLKKGKGV